MNVYKQYYNMSVISDKRKTADDQCGFLLYENKQDPAVTHNTYAIFFWRYGKFGKKITACTHVHVFQVCSFIFILVRFNVFIIGIQVKLSFCCFYSGNHACV